MNRGFFIFLSRFFCLPRTLIPSMHPLSTIGAGGSFLFFNNLLTKHIY